MLLKKVLVVQICCNLLYLHHHLLDLNIIVIVALVLVPDLYLLNYLLMFAVVFVCDSHENGGLRAGPHFQPCTSC